MFISLASTNIMVLLPLLMYFRCNGNLKFLLLTSNEKSENWLLLLFHCRYFDKSSSEMSIEGSSTEHITFVPTCLFDWLSWQLKD